ncbi:MAG: hypothetical protein OEY94_08440 [Alphaproteobacteria bacterium]|nr:hypothetical protein [Alphaproteobacteria bacterium]
MRLFIVFLFLVLMISTPALADGKKSFDTSMVPKKGSTAPTQQPTQSKRPVQEQQPSSLLDQVLNERNDSKNSGSGMKSRTMSIPDDLKEKNKISKNVPNNSEVLDEQEDKQDLAKKETQQEEKKSAEQSIWDRYKAMANGADDNTTMKSNVNMTGNKDQIDTPESEKTSEKDEEKEKAAREYEEKKAQASILGRTLNDYLNNKQNKKISSRSYGNLNN